MADSSAPLRSNFQLGEETDQSLAPVDWVLASLVPNFSLSWTCPLLAVISWKICNCIPSTGLDAWLRDTVKGRHDEIENHQNFINSRINFVLALIYIGWLAVILHARLTIRSYEVLKIVGEVKRHPSLCNDVEKAVGKCNYIAWIFLVLVPIMANLPILFVETYPYNLREFGYRLIMNLCWLTPVLLRFVPAVYSILKLCDAQLDVFIAQLMRREELEDKERVSEMRPTVLALVRSGVFRASSSWRNISTEHSRISLGFDRCWQIRKAGALLLCPVLLLAAEAILHIDSYRLRGGHEQVLRFVFGITVVCTALYPVAVFNRRCSSVKTSHGYRAEAVRAVAHRYVDEARSLEEQAIYIGFLQYLDTARLGIKMGAVRITTSFLMSVFFKLGVVGSTMLQLMLQLLDFQWGKHKHIDVAESNWKVY